MHRSQHERKDYDDHRRELVGKFCGAEAVPRKERFGRDESARHHADRDQSRPRRAVGPHVDEQWSARYQTGDDGHRAALTPVTAKESRHHGCARHEDR